MVAAIPKAAVQPVRAAFAKLMPSSVHQAAGELDPGMFAAVALSIDWPEMAVVECICLGFHVVGVVPPSGCPAFRPVPPPRCA